MPTDLPLSVWPTAQQTSRAQRSGRYLALSTAHPAKMLPAIAKRAIAAYSEPGDLVVDPMCGIGTTLVEAIHQGRDAIGVEYEERWANVARANVELARSQGASGNAEVIQGDARQLASIVDPAIRGLVALVITSPPYGPSVHGQANPTPGGGITKWDHRYSTDPKNLAHRPLGDLLDGFTSILDQCRELLRPGGFVAVTARPWRRDGELIDLPAQVLLCAEAAGLILFERNVALLAALRDDSIVPRVSFFQLNQVRKARKGGLPLLAIAHEDLLVLRRPK